ncbi:MATE family efflux transporter [Roseicyclus persicicus]|uniref:Multidrug-efflux transporter n=1 Tax=Roseicyclus persicicus TaxID=2650661 RepID=A0A7X6GVL7_9RHOB|nr:MATE family efflux transporter [Roseibacterium persicicum]NKX43205.1 MATE family efflux transporter [Roseibacterium persicicum]
MPALPRTEPGALRAEIGPLLSLSVPMMVGLSASTLMGVVDTVMVAPLGTVALAAVGIASAVGILFLAALWGIVTITGVRMAQAQGAGDAAGVSAELRAGLALGGLTGLAGAVAMVVLLPMLGPIGQPPEVIAAIPAYWALVAAALVPFTVFFVLKALFDTIGRPWTGVALGYLGVGLNVPLNQLFIFELGFGLTGAGIASLLSQTATLAAALLLWRHLRALAPFRQPARGLWARVRAQWRDGWPLMLGYAGEGGSYALIGVMIGWLGAQALAANQIVHAVAGVAYVFPLGMAGAASIRVGLAVGGGGRARLRPILKAALLIVTGWMLAVMAVLLVAGEAIAARLSDDPAVVALAGTLFLAVAAMQVADGVQSTTLGALRGLLDTRWPTVVSLVAYWPVALPAGYTMGFVLGLGAVGVWIGFGLALAVAAVALPLRYRHLTRPKAH